MIGFEQVAQQRRLLGLYTAALTQKVPHIAEGLKKINEQLADLQKELQVAEKGIFAVLDKVTSSDDVTVLILKEFARLEDWGQSDKIHRLVEASRELAKCEDINLSKDDLNHFYTEDFYKKKYDLTDRHLQIPHDQNDFFIPKKLRFERYCIDLIRDNKEKLETFDAATPLMQGECCTWLRCDRRAFLWLCQKYDIKPFENVPGWCKKYDGIWYDSRRIRQVKELYPTFDEIYTHNKIHSFYFLQEGVDSADMFTKKKTQDGGLYWCVKCRKSWKKVPNLKC